ncbi:MAG: hypothetical protein WD990_10945 [Acidimicrobiia bacterium]
MSAPSALVAVFCLLLGACGGGADSTTTTLDTPAPSTPEAVFAELVEALSSDDLESVVDLTDPAQVPLLAIAEGHDARSVAAFTAADRAAVSMNYWQGFAEQLRASIGVDLADLQIDSVDRIEVGETEFAAVELVLGRDASTRRMVLRNSADGWVVDLIASFPSPLLGQIPDAAQLIRSTGIPALTDSLRGYEPSVRFVLEDAGLDPLLVQAGTAALEAIVR